MAFLSTKPRFKSSYPIIYDTERVLVGGFGTNTEYTDDTGAVTLLF